jgi:uncharacterized damage-inducible protein DinB
MSKGEELAATFEQANGDIIKAVEACPDEKWSAKAADEERNVSTIAHHVASSHLFIAGRVQSIATGGRLAPPDVDARNAEHAKEHPHPSKEETLALLKDEGAQAAEIIRGLSDDGLERSIEVPGRGQMSAGQVVEAVQIGHVNMHLPSLTA